MVTGATGFLGYHVLLALMQMRVDVTALARADREEVLEPLRDEIAITIADVWNKASLKGRARNHDVVIHLVGSAHVDPKRGLTYEQINLVSARHVINMAVTDGVTHVMLLSTVVRPLELPSAYIRSKRDAEIYLRESGVHWTVVRSPAIFAPQRHRLLSIISALGAIFPFNILFGRYIPIPATTLASGIAAIATQPLSYAERIVYANDVRRAARRHARLQRRQQGPTQDRTRRKPKQMVAHDVEDSDESFGWTPPKT